VTIRFEVEDTGQGIAQNELNKLFKPFTQTETGLKSGEGTGLGLPISQKICATDGGEIAVNSVLGQGSKFAFEIQVIPVEEMPIGTTKPVDKSYRFSP
jgi:two-component system sensor histidine kinase/response regulator